MAILVAVEMRILIVEDDRKLARQLKKGVDEFGHSSTLAFDGREGLDAAQGSEFDVLVLDVMLPKMDGISVVRQLRQMRIGTPILLLTARDTPDDISMGLDAGADDYLTNRFYWRASERSPGGVRLIRRPCCELAISRSIRPRTKSGAPAHWFLSPGRSS